MSSGPQPGPRVVVIGLDGATFRVLDPVVQQGWMPHLAELVQRGSRGELEAPMPPVTGPSWVTFMTGKNPAKHGIFNFTLRVPGSYKRQVIHARSIRTTTLWRLLHEAGVSQGVFNVPVTYPPEQVDGYMVTGFLTPDSASDFTHPQELAAELQGRFGEFDLDNNWRSYGGDRAAVMLDDLLETTRQTGAIACHLLRERPTDFFMMVYNTVDRMQHALWNIVEPAARGERVQHFDRVRRYFETLDASLAEVLEAAGPGPRTTLVLSDHGFGDFKRTVAINGWLRECGLLALRRGGFSLRQALLALDVLGLRRLVKRFRTPAMLPGDARIEEKIDWSGTRAYAASNSEQGIYVNLAGREPDGVVPEAEYEKVRDEIIAALGELRDPGTGRELLTAVYRREELYSGPYLEQAPDVCYGLENYETIGVIGFRNRLFQPTTWYDGTGTHRLEGMMIAEGPGIRPGGALDGARMIDLLPTLLHRLGQPVPADVDGRVLTELYTPDYLEANAVRTSAAEATEEVAAEGDRQYTEEEAKEIEERLRGLGYLD